MEKEIVRTSKNRELTELALLKAVDDLIEEDGFENLGINAVAAKAGLSKMLIYRYFESLEGLIVAYIELVLPAVWEPGFRFTTKKS